MKDRIKKHGNLEKNLEKKLIRIEEIIRSNERNAVKVDLINDILEAMTEQFIDIHRKSLTDELTGFVNRWFLNEFLRKKMKSSLRYGHNLSLAMIDLNYLKSINDNFGHNAGDMVIKELSEIIKENIRSADVVSRFGGDEFVIVFPSTKLKDAKMVMNRMKETVREHNFKDSLRAGISIGVVELKGKHKLAEDLIKDADDELYKDKKKKKEDPNKELIKKLKKK